MSELPPDIPRGASTGLSHDHSRAIDECALFLATMPPHSRPKPLVPALKAMFGLSAAEACEAIRHSHLIKARAA
ncbi:hypothetical protein FJ938_24745 [Mesorhizobium sp. B2-4-14]|nr:hypothetical protein FJ548_07295 [Mesorhizobium sp. B2-4-17]TPK98877.1 hypothetical protein FJ938_24745 [Mesorhizobium sp. B2-4-14]